MQYDVFNGDADGICALHQLRLANPIADAQLVSGVKRDINLLAQIEETVSSSITVLDVSLASNRDSLIKMLANGNRFLYIDHHFAGDIPDSELLECHIEPSAETCTSLIVNSILKGRYCNWAICGAFGDNLHEAARSLAVTTGLDEAQIKILQEIGELFNYNGYGSSINDLHIPPLNLYRALKCFDDPLEFYQAAPLITQLRDGYKSDMALAMEQKDISLYKKNRVYMLPATAWARRMSGVFSNLKARQKTSAAHAVIIENDDSTLQISVRAPLADKKNADTLCRQFPTGGGRAAAAGINNLPAEMLDDFLQAFHKLYR